MHTRMHMHTLYVKAKPKQYRWSKEKSNFSEVLGSFANIFYYRLICCFSTMCRVGFGGGGQCASNLYSHPTLPPKNLNKLITIILISFNKHSHERQGLGPECVARAEVQALSTCLTGSWSLQGFQWILKHQAQGPSGHGSKKQMEGVGLLRF